MKKVQNNLYDSDQELIRIFLMNHWDDYKEWHECFYPGHVSSMQNAKEKKYPLKYCRGQLEKQELEKVFREREKMTLEETNQYVGTYWINPTVKKNMATLLVVYQDFYHQDENYNEKLWSKTVNYFEINDEDLKYARNGWEPEWVKKDKE